MSRRVKACQGGARQSNACLGEARQGNACLSGARRVDISNQYDEKLSFTASSSSDPRAWRYNHRGKLEPEKFHYKETRWNLLVVLALYLQETKMGELRLPGCHKSRVIRYVLRGRREGED